MKISSKNGLDNGTPLQTKLMLGGVFVLIALASTLCLLKAVPLAYDAQRYAYAIGFSVLLAGLLVVVMYTLMPRERYREQERPSWFYPVIAGVIAFLAMALSYVFLGVWPFGHESVMIVDMHHQYGPLLAHLRDMVLGGGSPLYTFEAGIGANFISMFAYYLASPFNLLLALLPETLLTEGILIITLLKNALAAAFFAALVQYLLKRRDMSVVLLSLGYSLSMYMIAYSWNIMWLDGVMVLPLLVLGFERMMREGKYALYILALAYGLFTNYYIGFMLCIFLVLYFIVFVFREKRNGGEIGRAFLRFAVGSLIGGGLAMCILLPVVFALGYTSAAGEQMPEFAATFELFRLPAQQLFGTIPTIRSGNLPNIACGILPVVLGGLFFSTKAIPLRKRLAYGGLMVVMAVSCTVNVFDLVWHGLHTPNDLPYRFSFLYVFAALLLAANLLPYLRDITAKQIGGVLGVMAGYVVLYEMWQGKDADVFIPVYITLLLCVIYSVILLLIARRKLAVRAGYMVLTLVFTLEMTIGGGMGLVALNGNEYYTDRQNYVANDEHIANSIAVDKMVEIADKETNNGFYRAELLPRRTCVDTALYNYKGLTSFSSSNYYHTTRLLGAMGYADNGVNSYLYHSFVPVNDSLLGLKYLTLDVDLGAHPYLEKVDSTSYKGKTHYIYRNKLALPLGYRVSSNLSSFVMQQYDPFATQESLLTAMTDDQRAIYGFLPVSVSPEYAEKANTYNTTRFSMNGDGGTTVWFTTTVETAAAYYGFVDCTAATDASIYVYNANGEPIANWSIATNEPYIVDMGSLEPGDRVDVSVTADYAVTGNIFIASMDNAVMEEKLASLADEGMQVTAFSQHAISATLEAKENGTVFTSIPYDASWQVVVDGQAVETYPVGDLSDDGSKGAFLAFDVQKGAHTIEMTFIPKGLIPGLILTVLSLACFIVLLIVVKRKQTPPAAQTPVPSEPAPYVPKAQREVTEATDVLSDDVSLNDLLSEEETPNNLPVKHDFTPEDFEI